MKLYPSSKQLQYLAALYQHRHFGQAASACFVTTPTLSAGIKELEQVLGVVLAERSNRSVHFTAAGEALARQAVKALAQLEEMTQMAKAQQAPLSGPFRLGVIPTIGPFLMPPLVAELAGHHPDLDLYIEEYQTDMLLSQLRDGRIDAAVIALPYSIDQFESRFICDDQFYFTCPRTHPLAASPKLNSQALDAETMLLMGEGHCLTLHAAPFCQRRGQAPVLWSASSIFSLAQMVAAGQGTCLLPEMAVQSGLFGRSELSFVPLEQEARREIHLIWRPTTTSNASLDALYQRLIKAVSTTSAL